MKSISELSKLDGKVYVYFSSSEICNQFFSDAELEGFIFGDGLKPTQKHTSDLIAVNPDKTLNYVGTVGRIAYGSGIKRMYDKKLIRVDYKSYIVGKEKT